MLVSRHVASYVPDLPAIKIHQIKDEEWREEDKLYFPICVFLLFLWFVLIDLHFVLTHVGHIWHWFPVCQHHPRPDMAKNYPSRQTDTNTWEYWRQSGHSPSLRSTGSQLWRLDGEDVEIGQRNTNCRNASSPVIQILVLLLINFLFSLTLGKDSMQVLHLALNSDLIWVFVVFKPLWAKWIQLLIAV